MTGFRRTRHPFLSSAYLPAFQASANAVTSVAPAGSGIGTRINFAVESLDVGGNYDPSISRFTPKHAGWYQFNAVVNNNGQNHAYYVSLVKNAADRFAYSFNAAVGSGVFAYANTSGCIYLNGSSDYVEVFIQQYSSGSLNMNTLGYFNGCFLRP